jgi:hypothetical protein
VNLSQPSSFGFKRLNVEKRLSVDPVWSGVVMSSFRPLSQGERPSKLKDMEETAKDHISLQDELPELIEKLRRPAGDDPRFATRNLIAAIMIPRTTRFRLADTCIQSGCSLSTKLDGIAKSFNPDREGGI